MINGMFSSSSIPVLEQWVNFAQSRHNVLASNVANIDVPGYQTRDLSVEQFQSNLRDALSARDDARIDSLSAGGGRPDVDAVQKMGKNLSGILYHDQSNVGLEQQVAAITKNHMEHNLALTILNSQFRMLTTAISERA
jgi:flagellar basal-body rod protein FlgB